MKAKKILKYSIFTILIIFVLLFVLITFEIVKYHWPDNYHCWKGDGSWDSFPSTCHDECYYLNNPRMCGAAFTMGCDCGPDKCWDVNSCIPNEDYNGTALNPSPDI